MRIRRASSSALLGAGIAAISFGAIFTRLAEAPAPAVAALRLLFSSALLAPAALASRATRQEIRSLSRRDGGALLLAGVFLGLHFILWIASLSRTGVASSVVLVTTSPLWVGLYAVFVRRERVPRAFWIGLAISIAGGAVIGAGDLAGSGGRAGGDMLAAGGAVAVAGYFLVGSGLRARTSILTYVTCVYSIAAIVLAAGAFVLRVPLSGYPGRTYLFCFLMALVCQVVGHSLFNWALRYLPATAVTAATLGEPAGAGFLAYIILGEIPPLATAAGGAMILGGVVVVLTLTPGPVAELPGSASGR